MKLQNMFLAAVTLSTSQLYSQTLQVPIPNNSLPIITKPIVLQKAEQVEVDYNEKDEYYDQREMIQALKAGLEVLDEDPKNIENYINAKDYELIKHYTNQGAAQKLFDYYEQLEVKLRSKDLPLVRLQSALEVVLDIGYSALEENDTDAQIKTYKTLYESLPAHLKKYVENPFEKSFNSKNIQLKLRDIDELIEQSLDEIVEHQQFYSQQKTISKNPMAVSPSSERGHVHITQNNLGDRPRQCARVDYNSSGLILKTTVGNNRWLTSIKSQGSRGTCVAFAIVSTMESEMRRLGRGSVNLSEQSLYTFAELFGASSSKFKDGLNTFKALKKVKKKNYRVPFEWTWPYNPSTGRSSYKSSSKKYPNSCLHTPYYCSDRAFQTTKNRRGRWQYVVSSQGQKIRSYNNLKSRRKSRTMNRLIALNRPALMAMNVTGSFMNVTSSGYLPSGSYGSGKGGHAMMLVGYVSNRHLPSGVRAGRGGGYVVVKNSWGNWNGDCGFYYLDHDYVKNRISALATINL